jgi:hypothetical protein
MCYTVYLSTGSPADLRRHDTELLRFEKLVDHSGDPVAGLLEFQHRWKVGSISGCGCTFRHLTSVELGFGEPVDWYPEDADELEATRRLYAVISLLAEGGHGVDCIDRWEGADADDIKTLVVSLDAVSRDAFRLFENYRFRFSPGVRSDS